MSGSANAALGPPRDNRRSLPHGGRVDHVDHEGKSLRDLVTEKLERFRADRTKVPPPLVELEARLRDR
jgi:hypothetical protein